MAKYRKKPVEVEAFKIYMYTMSKRDYPQWFADAVARGVVYQKANPDYPVECTIRTLEGEIDANLGDYIIKGVNGELYPCKPDIFGRTYERCCDDMTSEERREVAERLREQLRYMREDNYYEEDLNVVKCGNSAYRNIAGSVEPYGNFGKGNYVHIVERLADLIDPKGDEHDN